MVIWVYFRDEQAVGHLVGESHLPFSWQPSVLHPEGVQNHATCYHHEAHSKKSEGALRNKQAYKRAIGTKSKFGFLFICSRLLTEHIAI